MKECVTSPPQHVEATGQGQRNKRKGLNGIHESTEGKTSQEAVITIQTIPTVSTWQQLLVEKEECLEGHLQLLWLCSNRKPKSAA